MPRVLRSPRDRLRPRHTSEGDLQRSPREGHRGGDHHPRPMDGVVDTRVQWRVLDLQAFALHARQRESLGGTTAPPPTTAPRSKMRGAVEHPTAHVPQWPCETWALLESPRGGRAVACTMHTGPRAGSHTTPHWPTPLPPHLSGGRETSEQQRTLTAHHASGSQGARLRRCTCMMLRPRMAPTKLCAVLLKKPSSARSRCRTYCATSPAESLSNLGQRTTTSAPEDARGRRPRALPRQPSSQMPCPLGPSRAGAWFRAPVN